MPRSVPSLRSSTLRVKVLAFAKRRPWLHRRARGGTQGWLDVAGGKFSAKGAGVEQAKGAGR